LYLDITKFKIFKRKIDYLTNFYHIQVGPHGFVVTNKPKYFISGNLSSILDTLFHSLLLAVRSLEDNSLLLLLLQRHQSRTVNAWRRTCIYLPQAHPL
jgi:hypothetical protein